MGIDEIQFGQWIATDSSNLETFVKPVEDFLDIFVEKLETKGHMTSLPNSKLAI